MEMTTTAHRLVHSLIPQAHFQNLQRRAILNMHPEVVRTVANPVGAPGLALKNGSPVRACLIEAVLIVC